jgi:hypothetical protein
MNTVKKALGLSVIGMALAAGLPANAELASNSLAANRIAANRIAANRLAGNRLASNRLSGNNLAGNSLATAAGDGAFSKIVVIELPNGSRVTY